jgi:hypothetical protein
MSIFKQKHVTTAHITHCHNIFFFSLVCERDKSVERKLRRERVLEAAQHNFPHFTSITKERTKGNFSPVDVGITLAS